MSYAWLHLARAMNLFVYGCTVSHMRAMWQWVDRLSGFQSIYIRQFSNGVSTPILHAMFEWLMCNGTACNVTMCRQEEYHAECGTVSTCGLCGHATRLSSQSATGAVERDSMPTYTPWVRDVVLVNYTQYVSFPCCYSPGNLNYLVVG